jgi:hypothetical protein
LDEVQDSNPENPLEEFWDPENIIQLSEPWNSLTNRVRSYFLTLPISNWVDSLIGPSGLLLVVSHLLAVPSVSFRGVVPKNIHYNLDVRNIFARSHTEHWWRCSY